MIDDELCRTMVSSTGLPPFPVDATLHGPCPKCGREMTDRVEPRYIVPLDSDESEHISWCCPCGYYTQTECFDEPAKTVVTNG